MRLDIVEIVRDVRHIELLLRLDIVEISAGGQDLLLLRHALLLLRHDLLLLQEAIVGEEIQIWEKILLGGAHVKVFNREVEDRDAL